MSSMRTATAPANDPARDRPHPRFASVYPLVTARAVARPFTYLADDVEPGSVVAVPFGRSTRRGVVVAVGDEPPEGVDPVPIERVVGRIPAPLVELALWLADFYGSTPARALALVAPPARVRRVGAKRRAAPLDLDADPVPAELTAAQTAALERIVAALGSPSHVLLHGATGSGKTEVYIRACEAALERGRSAIVLVPEIALTPQAAARFRSRFGPTVAVLHSRLTEAERRDERERIARGEARIVVGARSAVFAPVEELGLIVVDEEHDASYKQESDPRYDARTVAAKRAALEGAVCVYGSATPRAESWQLVERLELGGRLGVALPPVRIVDLRREPGYPLSTPLLRELGVIADGGGKAILLLNRRGVAPALHCRACGDTPRCSHCDVALTLHADGRLHCHHCGATRPAAPVCVACGSPELARLGAGTERLEEELAARVPELERFRLDADTVAHPGRLAETLAAFDAADRAVLLGTQMVAKGHHFADVRLAAVVDADTGLGLPDFRAEERTFQLVTQLAGRSGRDAPGRVLVQTYQPDARPIALAARHAVEEFLAGELDRRRLLGYPPFRHLVSIVVSGASADGPVRVLRELKAELGTGLELLGPAPLLRLRGRYRAQLLAKVDNPRHVTGPAGRLLQVAAPAMRRDGLAVSIDVDPQGRG
jgi:primosomal protein N' (replication factor Y) (superfamily II helicase)